MLRVNATAGQRGAEQGRTVGTQTNTIAHLSKYVLHTAAPEGPLPITVDSLVPRILTALLGKPCHGTLRRTGEQKIHQRGGGGWGRFMAATRGTAQHSTTQSNAVLKQLWRSSD